MAGRTTTGKHNAFAALLLTRRHKEKNQTVYAEDISFNRQHKNKVCLPRVTHITSQVFLYIFFSKHTYVEAPRQLPSLPISRPGHAWSCTLSFKGGQCIKITGGVEQCVTGHTLAPTGSDDVRTTLTNCRFLILNVSKNSKLLIQVRFTVNSQSVCYSADVVRRFCCWLRLLWVTTKITAQHLRSVTV